MSHITCYKTCLKDAAYEGKLKKGGGSQARMPVHCLSETRATPIYSSSRVALSRGLLRSTYGHIDARAGVLGSVFWACKREKPLGYLPEQNRNDGRFNAHC